MGLTKSPAGVPYNYGIDGLIREETRIYTDRLAESWATDPQRSAVVERAGLPANMVTGACKVAAVALLGRAREELQTSAGRAKWTVRQFASMDQQAFRAVNGMAFSEWEQVMVKAIIPSLTEDTAENQSRNVEEEDAEFEPVKDDDDDDGGVHVRWTKQDGIINS